MTDDITALFARIRVEQARRPRLRRRPRTRRALNAPGCGYVKLCRSLALQESMALRAFARQGRLPRCRPLDYWAEWERTAEANSGSFKAAA